MWIYAVVRMEWQKQKKRERDIHAISMYVECMCICAIYVSIFICCSACVDLYTYKYIYIYVTHIHIYVYISMGKQRYCPVKARHTSPFWCWIWFMSFRARAWSHLGPGSFFLCPFRHEHMCAQAHARMESISAPASRWGSEHTNSMWTMNSKDSVIMRIRMVRQYIYIYPKSYTYVLVEPLRE